MDSLSFHTRSSLKFTGQIPPPPLAHHASSSKSALALALSFSSYTETFAGKQRTKLLGLPTRKKWLQEVSSCRSFQKRDGDLGEDSDVKFLVFLVCIQLRFRGARQRVLMYWCVKDEICSGDIRDSLGCSPHFLVGWAWSVQQPSLVLYTSHLTSNLMWRKGSFF